MNLTFNQYRLMTGIRSHRPNPIVINKNSPALLETAQHETVQDAFEAVEYDRDHAYNCTLHRWFRRQLYLGEEILMTADQLKMICAEVHEMGRLRERKLLMASRSPSTIRLYSPRR